MTIDGVASGALTLAHGTYTATQLAAALQTAITGAPNFTSVGIAATATLSGGKIVLASASFGTASTVASIAGTALTALGFNGSESGSGTNVAGSYSLNGSSSAATGSGQLLTGVSGSAGTDLKILYTGNAAQVAANPTATLDFSRGFAARLAQLATDVLDSAGAIAGKTAGFAKSIANVGQRRNDVNRRLLDIEARYRAQFGALDTLLSNLNQTSSFLTQQLASLNSNK